MGFQEASQVLLKILQLIDPNNGSCSWKDNECNEIIMRNIAEVNKTIAEDLTKKLKSGEIQESYELSIFEQIQNKFSTGRLEQSVLMLQIGVLCKHHEALNITGTIDSLLQGAINESTEAFGKSLHRLNLHKPSIEVLTKLIDLLPSVLTVCQDDSLPVQTTVDCSEAFEYIPLLAKALATHNDQYERGGLLVTHPQKDEDDEDDEYNTLQFLCQENKNDVATRLKLLKELQDQDLFSKEDVRSYNLLFYASHEDGEEMFHHLVDLCPDALFLKGGNEYGWTNSRVLVAASNSVQELKMILDAGLKHFPEMYGFLFEKGTNGKTALDQAWDEILKNKESEEDIKDGLKDLFSKLKSLRRLPHDLDISAYPSREQILRDLWNHGRDREGGEDEPEPKRQKREHVQVVLKDEKAKTYLQTIRVPVKGNIVIARNKIPKNKSLCQYYGFLNVIPCKNGTFTYQLKDTTTLEGEENLCFASSFSHSCEPNCIFVEDGKHKGVVIMKTTKEVRKGEELTVDYGPEFEGFFDKCLCTKCGGPTYQELLKKENKRAEEVTPKSLA